MIRQSFVGVIILFFYFICQFSILAQSNEGKEFWFAFLQHRDNQNSKKCIITSKFNTKGIIEMPSIGWSKSFTVAANSVFIVDIPKEAELFGSETVTKQGVHVITDDPCSVYIHQYFQFRADAALILPVESLGNLYYIMSYHGYQNQDDHYPSEFLMIGTEDNTVINLTYSCYTARGNLKGGKQTVTLNRGETFQVQAATVNDDLTGTYIESDKPISVLSGNRWTQIPNGKGNRDNLLEQMYPVEVWGKQFITIPSKQTIADRFRILAAEDNTVVALTGNGKVPGPINLNKGQWVEFQIDGFATLVQASRPIMVAQFLLGGESNGLNGIGDPSMVLLNSVEQMRDTVTLYNSPYEDITRQFINLITLTKDTGNLMIDGQSIIQTGNQFKFIGPSSEYAYSQLSVTQGTHLITSGGCGVIAIAYGYGNAESYAYGGGANFYKLNKVAIPNGSCFRDSIEFKSGLPPTRFDVTWNLGDGTIIKSHKFKYSYKALGSYTVKLLIHDLCRDVYDSTNKVILITLRENLIAYPDTIICENSNVQLFSFDRSESQYEWIGPNNYKSDKQNPILRKVKKNQEGIYTVSGIYFGCATFPRSIELIVVENPMPNLGKDTFFCSDNGPIQLSINTSDNIIWEDGSNTSNRLIFEEGIYSIRLVDEYNCFGVDSISIVDKCPLVLHIPNVFSPNGDNINDIFSTFGSHINSYRMEIFTRWGERIFTSTELEEGWDGKISDGNYAAPGVYIYLIQVEGYNKKGEFIKEKRSGDLTLVK